MSPAAILVRRSAAHRTALSLAVAGLACSMAQPASAQQASAPAPAASAASQPQAARKDDETQSVVVTANRRREPSREVPMQVNVLSAAELQKAGARTLTDYMAAEPGVDVKTYGGAGLGGISIRGVSTGDQTSSTVGTYIDDVAVGSSTAFANGAANAIDMALLDLNHIEVLRGPQGTLYGAGAMGGVVKYVTNEPDTYELSGSVSLGGSLTRGGGASSTISGILNVPLKEDVAGLRVSAFTNHEGGYVDAAGPAARKNVDSGRTEGARLSLLVEPNARFKIRLTETVQDLTRNGSDYVDYDYNTGRPYDLSTGAATASPRRFLEVPEPYLLKIAVTGADLEYDFGWARLNAITSVQQTRYDVRNDLSTAYVPLIVGATGMPARSVLFHAVSEVKKQSQEFRLTSAAGGDIEWIGGLWWDHEVGTNDQTLGLTLDGGEAGPDLIAAALPSQYHELAAYGDLTWNATKRLAVTGGLRVARNRQTFGENGGGLLAAPIDESNSSAETSKTYMLTTKYALTPDSNVYVRAASGYRPGGPNFVILDPDSGLPSAPLTFKHDSLWSYEAGYKADLLEHRLNVEASVYDISWQDIQQTAAVNGLTAYVNSGKAKIKGAELAATWKATRSLTVGGNLALIDAKLSQPAEGLGRSGSRLPNTARVAGTVSARYGFELAACPSYISFTERYTGKRNAGFDGSNTIPDYKLPSYAMTDFQAGIDIRKFALSLFVRNAFDRRAQLGASTTMVPLGGPVWVSESRPREVGLTLSAGF
jgi:iron complex outermembrane recepter protein